MKKVPASEATRKRLEEVFSGEHIDPSRVVREAARLMSEEANLFFNVVAKRYERGSMVLMVGDNDQVQSTTTIVSG